MEIIWHGQSCFTIKGKDATIVIDPYGEIGLKLPKLTADILAITHDHESHNNVAAVDGDPHVFDWPGEYEKRGILMTVVSAFHYPQSDEEGATRGRNNLFHFEIDGFRVCHLGDLGHKLTDEMIEMLGDVDILMVPVGGGTTIDHKKAHEVVEQIDPRVVIPMHYKINGLKRDDMAGIAEFLKEVGSHEESLENYKIKSRSDLPEETTAFVTLEANLG
jgi:L-ascorbate metabolism protein UlaG (beta-lactamase superfamily)